MRRGRRRLFIDPLVEDRGPDLLCVADRYAFVVDIRRSPMPVVAFASGMEQGTIRHGDAFIMAELQFAIVDRAYNAWCRSGDPSSQEDYIAEAILCMGTMLALPGN